MSWLPILLIVWVAIDVVIVAAVAHFARRAAAEGGAPATLHPLAGHPVRRPGAGRTVH